MLGLDVLCWWLSARVTKTRALRWVIAVFMGGQMLGMALIVAGRVYRTELDNLLPKFAVSLVFIWHFIGLGLFVLGLVVAVPVVVLNRIVGWIRRRAARSDDESQLNRREFLGVAAALAPPVFTFSVS